MARSVEACVSTAIRAEGAEGAEAAATDCVARSDIFNFLGIDVAAAEAVKNQIGNFLPAFEMLDHHALNRRRIFAAVPDTFRVHHHHRCLRLAGHHAMRTGTLDAQLGARVDLLAEDGEHGLGQHAVFGAARAGAHQDMPMVGSHVFSSLMAKMPIRPIRVGSAFVLWILSLKRISCKSIQSVHPAPARTSHWPRLWRG